jgi:long-chain fatty acid transport protein
VPSGNRWLYTIGATVRKGNLSVDFAYNYLDDENRKYDNESGDYPANLGRVTGEFFDTYAHIFQFNINYAF